MSFWHVFSVTFLIGLGGAMSPGPLLSYTIMKSIEAKKKGFLAGLFVSIGHMLIELLLILILMFGLGLLLLNLEDSVMMTITIIVGVLGGCIMVFFGSQILNDIRKRKIDTTFLESTIDSSEANRNESRGRLYKIHPIIGSILFLMSNPYWWIWWFTAGFSIITDNAVSFQNIPSFIGLLVGKELGVFLWYTFLGTAVGLSSKFITKKVYIGILIVCALFMVGYGMYLIISPIISFF
ncbi:MAG: LysE family transporter [Promethearchaeota archaeon]